MKNYLRKPIKRVWLAIIVVVLLFAAGRQGAFGQTNTFPSSGNVGIGTTTPQNPFTLNKTGTLATGNWYNLGAFIEPTSNKGIHLGYDNSSQTGLILSGTNGPASNLAFWTYNGTAWGERMRLDSSGNVGIGTISPQNALDVNGSLLLRGNTSMSNPTSVGPAFNAGYYATGGYAFFQGYNYTTSGYIQLDIDASKTVINANSGGNVGIGTTTPGSKLEVAGNIGVTGTGNITASGTIMGGNIVAKYQDVAEWVPSSEQLPVGTVVVLDSTKSNQVVSSSEAYDTRVAGVVSAQPGIALGESGAGKVLVATTGRVLVKVDASQGPIHIGDLLVTSDVPGVAMKSEPISIGGAQIHRPGTLIGKALEPLEKGSGKILVLLSLQ
jgi:hypothetical protein